MQIQTLGTGAILTEHRSSSFLIDGNLLIDCPNGIVKTMRQLEVDIASIDACLITHFHADHYFDMPFLLLELGLRQEREREFTIVGPVGVSKYITDLFALAYPEDIDRVFARSKPHFIETANNDIVTIPGYEIHSWGMVHGSCNALGYTVANGSTVAGFSGDSTDCANVESIVEESDIAFLDASFVEDNSTHMGALTFLRYLDKFGKDRKLVPTHLSDSSRAFLLDNGIVVPVEGDLFVS